MPRRASRLTILVAGMLWAGVSLAQVTAHAGNDATMCAGGPVTLGGAPASGGTGPYTYTWTPTTGLSNPNTLHPVCTAASTQTYTLTATDAGGATGTDMVTITVNPLPVINLNCNNATTSMYGGVLTFSVCGLGANPYAFDFTDASSALPGATYSISWGNGNSQVYASGGWSDTQTFPFGMSSGTYVVQEPGPNGCSRTVPFHVFVGEVPLGGLSVVSNSSICTGSAISFEWNNFSTNPPGTLYIVDYGDGVVDTLQQPPSATFSHTYTVSSCVVAGGEYTIQWRITNPCDTRTGQIGQIRVSGMPVADFSMAPNDTACVNSTVSFTDLSQGEQAPTCTGPKHIWSISPATGWSAVGALGQDNGQPTMPAIWTNGATTLNVTFTVPGTYVVTEVTGNICGTDTLTRTICVEEPPQPVFTLSQSTGCSPLTVTTDNQSTSPNSCFTRYNWLATVNSSTCGSGATATFSGGTQADSFEPQFTFTGAGNYTVTLRGINSCGTFPVTTNVVLGAPPEVAINPLPGICAGQSASPAATFTPCGSPITGYTWTFPGGSPSGSTSQHPGAVSFASPGSSTITATATSACGSGTDNITLPVTPLPSAPVVGGPIVLCVGEDLQLSAGPMPGATFQWSGPNGFSSTSPNPLIPAVTLSAQGTYTVTASTGGCSGPASTVQVTVNPAPVVSIAPSVPTACAGDAVTLTASGGSNYQWTVGGAPAGGGSQLTFTPAASTVVVLSGDANGCTASSSTLVTVYPLPTADAGIDPTYCESTQPQPLFPVSPGGTWSGSPLVTPGGQFTPSAQGTYTLTYTVLSPQGCPNSDQVTVTVAPPAPPATAGPDTLLCQNGPTLQMTGTPAGGSWTGDISIGGLFTPDVPGTFTVTYTAGNGSCSTSDQAVITVVAPPTVDPGADQQLCVDAPVLPLTGTPAGGTWSGPGVTGGNFNPQAAGTGAHALAYTVSDADGCSSTGIRTITVDPLPVVSAGNDTTFCDQPFAQTLTGFAPAGGTWAGTGVTPGGSFTPNGPGGFPLTYTYTDGNGCTASDQMTVTVITITNPAQAGNDTAVCINSGALQLAGGLPTGGAWSGPQVDASGLFDPSVAGTFTLTYSVGNGSCITQDQLTVTVDPLPAVAITAMDDACVDAGLQTFTATPAGGTWSGAGITDAAAGSFDPALAGVGTFPITYSYTDANGCANAVAQDVEVAPLPVAAFTNAPIACSGMPFTFTETGSGGDSWAWDFGDGGTSAVQSPDHTFGAEGSYDVTLTATSAAGCSASVSQAVTVWAGPTADFSLAPADGCGPLPVSFSNQSTGNGLSHAWDLGDGSSSTLADPGTHTYPASLFGDTAYTVTLSVTNTCGTVDSSLTVTVHPAPTALFGPDFNSGCSPWPVTFSNVTIGQADSYWWDFGDGTTGTLTDSLVQHTYFTGADDTTYTITLVASNACGSDTADYTITVLPNSITAFFNTDTTSGCAPLTVNFTQYSIGANNWHWDLGDGNVSTAQHVTHTYDSAGSYTATLFADNGCSYDTVSVVITVNPTPAADFAIAPGLHCAGAPVQFTNLTPSPAGLTWDFGDGTTSTLSAPLHAYANAGSYTVTLSVASTNTPCPAMASQVVQVSATPTALASAIPASGCVPLEVQFSSAGSAATDFQQWDFGDGNTSADPAPAHGFTGAGTYTIRLVAGNISGCTDTAYTSVTAFPLPTAGFIMGAQQSCTSPASLQLTSTSVDAVGLDWDFGNGSGSVLNNPVAVYDGPGIFTIHLEVANMYGCTDTASGTFTVHPTPVAAFTPQPVPACAGYPVHFLNQSLHATGYAWSFGDGGTSQEENPEHAYTAGDFDVSLAVSGAGGCTDTLLLPAAVHVNPSPVADFSYTPMQSATYALQFHNTSTGAVEWLWDFGDGEQSTEFQPMHLFPAGPDNLYPFCLVATNEFNCPDTLCRSVAAVSDPNIYAPNAFTPDGDGLNEDFRPVLNGFENWRYQFLVFDRWGELIHQSSDRGTAWNGSYKGKPVKSDVYVWKVVLNREGDERVYYGHVTVVRGTE